MRRLHRDGSRLAEWMFLAATCVAILLAGAVTRPQAAAAQATPAPPLTPQAALERLFTTTPAQADWFAPAFLAQVPLTQVESILSQLPSTLGSYERVQPSGDGFVVVFSQGTVLAHISLDSQGRIAGLTYGEATYADPAQAISQAVSSLQALPGDVSLLVQENGQETLNLNADQPLAVGSAFKLAVLLALRQQIAAGQLAWDDVVMLQPQWKTLPSGLLQTWPDGSPMTVNTLASLMISQSDNTAADGVMSLVGRSAIEAVAPGNVPFPTPRELFTLKDPANQNLLDQWRSGDVADRRAVLQQLDALPNPPVSVFSDGPIAPDVEWFFSAHDLCSLMGQVQDLPLMSINPGAASAADWSHIAYKGGSEAGVLNLTQWLVDANGNSYCVAATWNNSSNLDEKSFESQVEQLISGLASEARPANVPNK